MRALKSLALIPLMAAGLWAQDAPTPAEAVDWRFAHPGATLVGGLRVDTLLQSPILNKLIAQGTSKDQASAAMVSLIRTALSRVTAVNFSLLDMGANKNPDVLVLVTGFVDDNAMAGMASQGQVKTHRIDANHVLMGQGFMLDDAVRRMSDPAQGFQSHAIERAKTMKDYDLWLAGSLPNTPMTAAVGGMLKGLSLGVSVQSDLRVELSLDTASEEMARELVKQARESQKNEPALKGASIEAYSDGATARLRFRVDGDKVLQAVQDAIGNSQFSSAPGLLGAKPSGTVTITPATPPKPERKTIIIYGLDDGPRVIDPDKK